MEKLAFELLTSIFELACTDGGYTACSLSRVCKHVREVSYPLRFHTVALFGAQDQMKKFLVQLEDERAFLGPNAPQVRHLFFHTQNIELDDDIVERGAFGAIDGEEDDPRARNPEPEPEVERTAPPRTRAEYATLVSTILRAVAPALETLVFLPYFYAPPVEAGIVFPALRELTLDEPAVDLADGADLLDAAATGTPRYPVLSRLHLLAGSMGVDTWAYHAPELTHIRVSGVHYRTRLTDLTSIYGDPESGYAVRAFKRLQTAIFQVTPPPSQDYCGGVTYRWYESVVYALWESQVVAYVSVYILPPPKGKTLDNLLDKYLPFEGGPWYREHLEEWKDRLKGGVGCWDTLEEYARAAYGSEEPPPSYLAPCLESA
ncbi:hypothetical protein BC628DRAFT_1324941 [Trametes gibbosa]|nr:hypothetical protein BC628DRAFT_1324941 [Trametes gibbosa]